MDSRTIDAIHARMLVRYGSKWINMWAGVDMEMIKADWALELESVRRDQVLFALDHLPPEFPPTAGQFRALCREHRPGAEHARYVSLPMPARSEASDAKAIAAKGSIRALVARMRESGGGGSREATIERLRAIHEAGGTLTVWQRDVLRELEAETEG